MAKPHRRDPMTEGEIQRMRDMREEGIPIRDIGRRFGVSTSTAGLYTKGTKRLFGVDEQPRTRGRPRKPTGCGVTHSVQP